MRIAIAGVCAFAIMHVCLVRNTFQLCENAALHVELQEARVMLNPALLMNNTSDAKIV